MLCDLIDYSPPGFSVHGSFPGKNTGSGHHFLLQRILLTQGSNLHPLPWQVDLPLSHQGSPERSIYLSSVTNKTIFFAWFIFTYLVISTNVTLGGHPVITHILLSWITKKPPPGNSLPLWDGSSLPTCRFHYHICSQEKYRSITCSSSQLLFYHLQFWLFLFWLNLGNCLMRLVYHPFYSQYPPSLTFLLLPEE